MNPLELLNLWSALSTDEIAARLADGQDVAAAGQLFGTEEAAALANAAPVRVVSADAAPRPAVVLIPGIMGSLLASLRGITTLLWLNPTLFLKGQASYLELDEAGQRDRHPAISAAATALDRLCYLKAALTLRREAELFEFPYDWRRSILYNADVLAQALERWAPAAGQRLTLVAHSMGGLVARACLARHPRTAQRRVRRVITLGTPYFGTVEAVENIALGNGLLNLAAQLNPLNDVERILLSLPSLYELLPAPPDLFPAAAAYPVNWDLYSETEWRRPGLRGKHLAAGERFHRLLAAADPQVETVQFAGCNVETIVALERSFTDDEQPVFAAVRQEEGPESGDGPVPLWSAVHPHVPTHFVEEQHRYLPGNAAVQADVLELIHDGAASLPTELPHKRRGLAPRDLSPADAGAAADDLRSRLARGAVTESDLAQLYFLR